MTPNKALVQALCAAVERRDWSGVHDLLGPDFEASWPQSGERLDRAGYIAVNKHYPGEWSVRVEHLVEEGDEVVAQVEITIDGRVDRCVGFYRVDADHVLSARELWAEPFPVPAWRVALFGSERTP